ncbi:MAG: amidohydrolase family protein [Acidimicrobiales bacterium]
MPDAPPNPRPKPGPTPHDGPTSYVVDRRKVVFGLGFGVVAAAGLGALEGISLPQSSALTLDTVGTDTQPDGTAESDELTTVTEPVDLGPFEAPIFDETRRLATGQPADFVLTGGRIIDPQTGFDRIGNVAVVGNTIVEISDQPIAGASQLDAAGLVISPGFIDILSYQPNGYGEWWKVADGVTSNVGMHGLRFDAAAFTARWVGEGVPINFGGAVHNSHIRQEAGLQIDQEASSTDIGEITTKIEEQLARGYIGIHVQPEYSPGVSPTELRDMGEIAATHDVPLCVHARFSDNLAPGLQSDATAELVAVARDTGCHVHIEHLNSTGGTGRMADALDEIDSARAEGLRMSSCMYPYEFWATTLKSARFRDWQEKFGLTFEDLQVAGTNERLTEATFASAYDSNLLTAAFAIPPGDIELGFGRDFMMIGSDAILERPHNNHPRSTGCFSRVLGTFVRDQRVVDMVDALAMMTIRPAELLGLGAPAMRNRGRMQIGAHADITVFDPSRISDRSTIADPAQESVGVEYVMVNGTFVRTPAGTDRTVLPGQAILSALA